MQLNHTIMTTDGVIVPAGVRLQFHNGIAKYKGHPIDRRLVPLQVIDGARGPFLRACCATLINDCRRFQSEVKHTDYKDWAHCIVYGDYIVVYIWDTREVIDVIAGLHSGAAGGPIMQTKNLRNVDTGERHRQTKVIGHNRWGWSKSFYEMTMLPAYHRLDNGLPLVCKNDAWQAAIDPINAMAIKAQAAYEAFDPLKRDDYARTGMAMPDGSYPITDIEDLQNAIQAVGRAKDIDAVRQHIIARAKQLNAMHLLPEHWIDGANEAFFGNNGRGMHVYKYDLLEPYVRNLLHVKPEPWLHLGIVAMSKDKWGLVVYVWDTRKVLAECEADIDECKQIMLAATRMRAYAIDNGKKLQGGGSLVKLANTVLTN